MSTALSYELYAKTDIGSHFDQSATRHKSAKFGALSYVSHFFRHRKDPIEVFDYNDPRCNPLLRSAAARTPSIYHCTPAHNLIYLTWALFIGDSTAFGHFELCLLVPDVDKAMQISLNQLNWSSYIVQTVLLDQIDLSGSGLSAGLFSSNCSVLFVELLIFELVCTKLVTQLDSISVPARRLKVRPRDQVREYASVGSSCTFSHRTIAIPSETFRLLVRDLSHSSAKHLRLGLQNCVGYALNHCSCTALDLRLRYSVLENYALQLCTSVLLLILRLNFSSYSGLDLRAAPISS
ncbi:hypothetical protein F511_27880 [Dorcoceras hygrometricum]|uniref:Uncharacterized protein n=1 Tax=Dorcoceras hygrometricum TaxID=472368 RepID=A0A2Z7D4N2_9LAMI|nr:hypothetical protein F511_27880 [Dorcoceras hygrometricum]